MMKLPWCAFKLAAEQRRNNQAIYLHCHLLHACTAHLLPPAGIHVSFAGQNVSQVDVYLISGPLLLLLQWSTAQCFKCVEHLQDIHG